MKIFLLFLSAMIAIPSIWQWFRTYKSAELFAVKPFENYWQNVQATAPLGLLCMAFVIGGGAFHLESSIARLFGLAFLCLLFFPLSLLYFHSIAWLSEKYWAGMGFCIHIGLIFLCVYSSNGHNLQNAFETVAFMIAFLLCMLAIRLAFRQIKGLFA